MTNTELIDGLIRDLEAVNYEMGFEDAKHLPVKHRIERREAIRERIKMELSK